jgi:hypothetical protein
MVELLAAGISGANWSLDAGDFRAGDKSPGIGLTVMALMPPPGFAERAADHMRRLAGHGVHVQASDPRTRHCGMTGTVVNSVALGRIEAFASRPIGRDRIQRSQSSPSTPVVSEPRQ